MHPKTHTYQSCQDFTEKRFKEAIRSDSSYIEGGHLTLLQNVIEKRLNQFAPVMNIVICGDDKPHMTSQLRKAIMKRFRLKNKANKSGKPADKTVYKKQRNVVLKLNKKAKNSFLRNQITEIATNKQKFLESMLTFLY